MFSLCIPTMNRFDDFLIHNIPKYLENRLIDEIIITDENGIDIEKITKHFGENPKLKLFKNEHRLGPFMNKLSACSYAKNEWIALIDSDNFADEDYFITSKNYIETKIQQNEKNVILSPSKANPKFNFSILEGFIYKKNAFPRCEYFEYTILMNLGNYVINKYLIDHLDITNETSNIQNSSTCDVIFMNTLFFEQLNLNFHVVPHLGYTHIVHNSSIYNEFGEIYKHFNECIRQRHFRFISG